MAEGERDTVELVELQRIVVPRCPEHLFDVDQHRRRVVVAEVEVVLAIRHLQPRTARVERLDDAAEHARTRRRREHQRRLKVRRRHVRRQVELPRRVLRALRGIQPDIGVRDSVEVGALALVVAADVRQRLIVSDLAEARRLGTVDASVAQLELAEVVECARLRAVLVGGRKAVHAPADQVVLGRRVQREPDGERRRCFEATVEQIDGVACQVGDTTVPEQHVEEVALGGPVDVVQAERRRQPEDRAVPVLIEQSRRDDRQARRLRLGQQRSRVRFGERRVRQQVVVERLDALEIHRLTESEPHTRQRADHRPARDRHPIRVEERRRRVERQEVCTALRVADDRRRARGVRNVLVVADLHGAVLTERQRARLERDFAAGRVQDRQGCNANADRRRIAAVGAVDRET